jgi:hypothetical protein
MIILLNKNGIYIYATILRPPIKLAPKPKPAPPLADEPIAGINTSRTLNVAAAIKAIMTISSTFNCFFGIA